MGGDRSARLEFTSTSAVPRPIASAVSAKMKLWYNIPVNVVIFCARSGSGVSQMQQPQQLAAAGSIWVPAQRGGALPSSIAQNRHLPQLRLRSGARSRQIPPGPSKPAPRTITPPH